MAGRVQATTLIGHNHRPIRWGTCYVASNQNEPIRPGAGPLPPAADLQRNAAWLSGLRTRFGRIAASWAMRWQTIRSLRQLHICTDRELRDMGLSRADFPAIIKGTYTNAR
ncbi:MAG TPA: DUF1127 domain-containing protein [Acetobacteraceae bacterium]|jgi:uncharacterized protein YjiS (DUF1127 family)|nr:DUF1127 domain-containing protein [Acetobacteraceae bacterium]